MDEKISNSTMKQLSSETINAIFIIAFVSFFILANFATGFVLPLFVVTMAISAGIAFFYPRSGLAAIVFLTFIFERFFTLAPIIVGRNEYKLYPLDIILVAVLAGITFNFIHSCYGLRSQSIGVTGFVNEPVFWKKRGAFRADFYLIAFIILTAIYFFVSAFVLKTDFALSFSSFKNYAFYPLFYFAVIFLIKNKEQTLWLFKFALAGAVGIIFFAVYGLISGAGLWSEFTPLSTEGVRTLAFTHAFYLSLALFGLLTYLAFNKFQKDDYTLNLGREKVYNEFFYYFLVIIWIIGIVGSMMRHLWISLFLSIAALFLIIPGEKRQALKKILAGYVLLAALALAVIVYLSLLFPTSALKEAEDSVSYVISSRVGSLASVSGDESFSWRGVVWKETAKEYLKSPLLGIGLGKKIFVEAENYRDWVEVRNIHNSLLVILVQMGIAAFFVFLAFVYKSLQTLYKKINKDWIDVALLGILAFYLAVFLFQPYLETNLLGIFFWIILGLIRVKSYENTEDK